jgi:hypothetical protein
MSSARPTIQALSPRISWLRNWLGDEAAARDDDSMKSLVALKLSWSAYPQTTISNIAGFSRPIKR